MRTENVTGLEEYARAAADNLKSAERYQAAAELRAAESERLARSTARATWVAGGAAIAAVLVAFAQVVVAAIQAKGH